MNAIAELNRRIDNMIRLGTIAEVDHAKALCRVKTGAITTTWLPFFTRRAGTTSEWDPVSLGEQCTVLSPSGELAQGVVLVGLYSTANPPQSASPVLHRIGWANGDYVEHNAATGGYRLKLAGHVQIDAASLEITCTGTVSINGSRVDIN